ncbi:uncharacterized protein LAESUDRAFT_718003 [Laetiporus sulphureus 93-53]|uniref:Pentacotripeptide-repeat region of PRORP domain-containing protein n=1 Tax=Laetiporus sulphureus 93-53 TaxID=1314785 RepID=A0A165BB50_9APHY|nr:uncharacterized protein LAESUDRAFT_718003 [Laetiporus sulphureus 93-53]KZT00655.1 hypothetical protein LAESUDRAFT_718003 [Laetiporus sulphureus 93-53]
MAVKNNQQIERVDRAEIQLVRIQNYVLEFTVYNYMQEKIAVRSILPLRQTVVTSRRTCGRLGSLKPPPRRADQPKTTPLVPKGPPLYVTRASKKALYRHETVDANKTKDVEHVPGAISTLLEPVEEYLRLERPGMALRRFHADLDRSSVESSTRFSAYESAIGLFLRYRQPLEAAMILGRMSLAGYIPSVSARTQMAVMHFLMRSSDANLLMQELHQYFSNKSFKQYCLRDLLHLMDHIAECHPETMEKIVKLFLEIKGPHEVLSEKSRNLLVLMYTKAGSAESALRWISEPKPSPSESTPTPVTRQTSDKQAHPPHLYTTLFRNLASNQDEDGTTYRRIFQEAQEQGIVPDLPFCNALIAVQVDRRRYDQAFLIYRLLFDERTQTSTPDAFTYVPLFRAVCNLHRPHNAHTRGYRRPLDVPSPRRLFRDMLECHLLRNGLPQKWLPSPVLNGSVLRHALRMFMSMEDYAAALVILRSFVLFDEDITLKVYRIILYRLMHRVNSELVRMPKVPEPHRLWTYRFLGLASRPDFAPKRVDFHLFDEVLRLGTEPRINLDYIPPPICAIRSTLSGGAVGPLAPADAAIQLSQQHGMPPGLLIAGLMEDNTHPNTRYSVTPLQRILRRAVLAQRMHLFWDPAVQVSHDVAQAKAEVLGGVMKER